MDKATADIFARRAGPQVGSNNPAAPTHDGKFSPQTVRKDFPILFTKVYGKPLVYLDNGATTQKPRAVIDTIRRFYEHENANIHRGVYFLSQTATEKYEQARRSIRAFINATEDCEIIFTRGTTEAINLVASSWGRANLRRGDEVVLTHMEHHANIVPWQMICEQIGAKLRVIPINDRGELRMDEYERILASGRVKMVSVVHLSNSLGTINDVRTITRQAHNAGAKVLIDGAQWVAHHRTDVREIGCDFYAFSGHKMFGPTGVGVLYGRREMLEATPPYQGGGDMIHSVSFEKTIYADLPNKFEAGTPNIAGAIGLNAAVQYLQSIGLENIEKYEAQLFRYATQRMNEVPGLKIIGTADSKGGVISFVIEGVASHDIGVALDLEGVAVRTGHHCCQPVMDRFGIPATARMSLAMYNTTDDVDHCVDALCRIATKMHRPAPAATTSAPSELIEVEYPEPYASSPQAAADELAETFEFLDDPEARTQYVLELGEKLPHMPAFLKTEANRVHGCMSTVHFSGRVRPGTNEVVDFLADSDAHIVRGLIAILEKLYSGQKAREIIAFDITGFFRRIGLDQFISTQRRNGLAAMVKRIHTAARELVPSAS